MVYDRGKSHSSPSYSPSYNYTREKTPEERQQEERKRKESEQQREFEQQVKTASKLPPTQVKELIEGKIATKRELWYLFLDNLSSQYNSEVVAIVASAVSDDTLSFDKLIASGVSTDVAVEIYKNWNSLWGDTINQVATTSQLQKPEGELKTNSDIEAKQTDNKSLKASKAVREPTQQQQQIYREDSYEVAFLPAVPVAVIGGFVLVAAGATLLLQVEDENGELVTVNEYASRPIAELLEAISNDIKNYYQTGDEIAQIKKWVAPALEKIVVTEEPENQVYTTPLGERRTIEHTGSVPPEVETGTPSTDTGQQVETQRHTGHAPPEQQTAEDYVMESRWSSSYRYQKNAPQVNYKNEVHHIVTDAESQQSDLTQEAHDRGLWNVDRTTNLIRLPSTQAAYQQSPIKIKHRGSHGKWSNHARQTLKDAEIDLELHYGSLDNVPDNVLQQTLNQIETDLKNDLLNIREGINRGWIKVKPDGTQKLSREEDGAEIA